MKVDHGAARPHAGGRGWKVDGEEIAEEVYQKGEVASVEEDPIREGGPQRGRPAEVDGFSAFERESHIRGLLLRPRRKWTVK